jgi:hypothetical protein
MNLPFAPSSVFGVFFATLRSAMRNLTVKIDDEKRMGRSTTDLECELALKQAENRAFLAYLRGTRQRGGDSGACA